MEPVFLGIGLILLCIALYTIVPDLFLHRLGIGSWKRTFGPGVSLTFDDGPDPVITPRVLQTLSRHNCRATFFLTGERAIRHPELVKRIVQEGHSIGAHGMQHRYAWFTSPWSTWRKWDRCIDTLEGISGEAVELIRPPWGTFNLVTWLWCNARGKRAVLWGAEGHDWLARRNPKQIAERILKRVREGSIVLLHDNGGEPGAPVNSLAALDLLCVKIVAEKKLPILPLDFPNWSSSRLLLFILWEYWERVYAVFRPATKISSTNVFKLAKAKYRGPTIYAQNGEVLAERGDLVGELHLESIRLTGNDRDLQKLTFQAVKQFKASMPELALFVVKNPEFQDIRIFLGFTFINRGVQVLGFRVQELPQTLFKYLIGLIQKGVLRVYHPQGKRRGTTRLGDAPKVVWISRDDLLQKWLPAVNNGQS